MKKIKTIQAIKKTAKKLGKEQISKIKGGATEELFGSYHFLVETSE